MDFINLHGNHGMYNKIFFFGKIVKIKMLQPPLCAMLLLFCVFAFITAYLNAMREQILMRKHLPKERIFIALLTTHFWL